MAISSSTGWKRSTHMKRAPIVPATTCRTRSGWPAGLQRQSHRRAVRRATSWVHDLDDFGESAAMEDLFLSPSDMSAAEPDTSSAPDKIDTDAIFGMSYDSDEPGDWLGAADSDVPDWFGGMNLGAGVEQEMPAAPQEAGGGQDGSR